MRLSSLTATMRTLSAFLTLALVVSAVETHAADKAISLEIPDTGQEQRRPESGWCGEAAIQMALSYYGAYASQQAINRAGKPVHPDLYANEVPVAMSNLGMEFKAWQGEGMPAFLRWVQGELTAGHPVLLGVKIYPTAHPEWGLDHFVLAVGCTKESLTYNTTWKRQETRSFCPVVVAGEGPVVCQPLWHVLRIGDHRDQGELSSSRHEADADQDRPGAGQGSRIARHRRESGAWRDAIGC